MQPIFYMLILYIRIMYLYNITIITESDLAAEVSNRIKLLQAQYAKSDPFLPLNFLKMLDSPHEGVTFCLQLLVSTRDEISQFQANHLVDWQQQLAQTYPGKVMYFGSTMEYIK
jgi:hypothetical protein